MLQLILTQKHNNLFLKCNKLECQVCVSTFKFISQGCTQAVPGGLWRLTFALGQLENLTFFIQIICWAPWISQVQSTGLPSIFLRVQPCKLRTF